jgi:hypothetical protein
MRLDRILDWLAALLLFFAALGTFAFLVLVWLLCIWTLV